MARAHAGLISFKLTPTSLLPKGLYPSPIWYQSPNSLRPKLNPGMWRRPLLALLFHDGVRLERVQRALRRRAMRPMLPRVAMLSAVCRWRAVVRDRSLLAAATVDWALANDVDVRTDGFEARMHAAGFETRMHAAGRLRAFEARMHAADDFEAQLRTVHSATERAARAVERLAQAYRSTSSPPFARGGHSWPTEKETATGLEADKAPILQEQLHSMPRLQPTPETAQRGPQKGDTNQRALAATARATEHVADRPSESRCVTATMTTDQNHEPSVYTVSPATGTAGRLVLHNEHKAWRFGRRHTGSLTLYSSS